MKFITKKNCSIAGMICGLLAVILGIVILAGGLGGETNSAYVPYPASSYDKGFASFGADFYTYVVNNSAEAASASSTAANNVHHLSDFIKTVFGALTIAFGLFTVCLFGTKYAECVPAEAAPEKAAKTPEEAADQAIAEAEAAVPEETAESKQEKLDKLREQGVLTEEEYEKLKGKTLA